MANFTKNFQLIQPEDGAAEWGADLNTNFTSIDDKLLELGTKSTYSLSCAGLFGEIPVFDIQTNQIRSNKLNCYFPKYSNIGGGITSIEGLILTPISNVENQTAYINEYCFLEAVEINNNLTINTVRSREMNSSYFSDGKHIFLGNIVQSNGSFIPSLCAFTPWLSNYTLKDRIENFNSNGEVKNVNLQFNSGNFTIDTANGDYYWYLEGINYSDVYNSSSIANFLTTNSDNKIQFFQAIDNNIYDVDELVLRPSDGYNFEYKYYNNGQLYSFGTDSYGIFRISLTKTNHLAVFYPTKLYNTLEAAQGSVFSLPELNTSVPQKEVARLIANGDGSVSVIYNFYTKTKEIEDVNGYTWYLDQTKQGYTFADAAEVRSKGIVPTWDANHYITYNNNTNELSAKGTICTPTINNFINSKVLKYTDFEYGPTQLTTTGAWKDIIVDGVKLGYYVKGSTSGSLICIKPDLCTTHQDLRNKNIIKPLMFNGLLGLSGKSIVPSGYLKLCGEGINYKEDQTDYNIVQWSVTSAIEPRLIIFNDIKQITDIKNFNPTDPLPAVLKDNTSANGKYVILKLLILPNREFIMVGGDNAYTTEPTASDLFNNETTDIDLMYATEVARIVTNGTNHKIYYTYDGIGGTQVSTLVSSDIKPNFKDSEFYVYNANNLNKKMTVDASNSFTLKSTVDGQSYDLNDITVLKNNVGTRPEQYSNTIWENIVNLNAVTENFISKIVTTGNGAPTEAVISRFYIDVAANRIYIWDGVDPTDKTQGGKYQLVNSWQ